MLSSPAWLNYVMFVVGLSLFAGQVWSVLLGPMGLHWAFDISWGVQRVLALAVFGFVGYAEARGLIMRARPRATGSPSDQR
jgi:hypothetical protein